MRFGRHRTGRAHESARRHAATIIVSAAVVALGAVAPVPFAAAVTTRNPTAPTASWQVAAAVAETPPAGWPATSDVAADVTAAALPAGAPVPVGQALTYALTLSTTAGATAAPPQPPVVIDDLSGLAGAVTLDTTALSAEVSWDATTGRLTWTPATTPALDATVAVTFTATAAATLATATTATTTATVNGSTCVPGDPCATGISVQPAMTTPAGAAKPQTQTLGTPTLATTTCPAGWPVSGSPVAGFEIDGNFCVNTAGNLDWSNVASSNRDDEYNDNTAFTQGASETGQNGWPWTVGQVSGSMPSNGQSDIGKVFSWTQTAGGNVYGYFGFERAATTGTIGYYVELDQKPNRGVLTGATAPGPVPDRSAGDLRLRILQTGNTSLALVGADTWTATGTNTGTWTALPASTAYVGQVNQGPITDAAGVQLQAGQFGEIAINLTALFGNAGCSGNYGTLNVRTAASVTGTDADKDWVEPITLNVPSTCASVQVNKSWVIDGQTYSNTASALPSGFTPATLSGLTGQSTPAFGTVYSTYSTGTTPYQVGNQVTITEAPPVLPLGCSDTVSGDGDHTLTAGLNTFTVTNTVTCTYLTLAKVVDQNGTGGTATPASFTLTATPTTGAPIITGAGGSPAVTAQRAAAGVTYTLSESALSGYHGGAWVCTAAGGAVTATATTVTPQAGQNITCTVTNTAHQPTVETTATASAFSGQPIGDTATLTGDVALGAPTGAVTFTAYGPFTAGASPVCTGTAAFTSPPVALAAGSAAGTATAATAGFTPAADESGVYFWVASYGGDANYLPAAGRCGDQGETSTSQSPAAITVTKTLPSITPPNGPAVTNAAAGATVAAGDILGYTITLVNTGASPGEVTLTETVPANTSYTGTGEGWTCDATTAGGACTQTVSVPQQTGTAPNTTPGTKTVTFTVTVAATLPVGTLSIDNTVTPTGATCTSPDTTPTGCQTVNPTPPVLTVTKTLAAVNGTTVSGAGTPVMAGDTLTFRIVVDNTGGTAGSTTLTETVPANTAYTGTGEGWTCAATTAESACTQTVSVPAATFSATAPGYTAGTSQVTFTATVLAPVAGTFTAITNTVQPGTATCTNPDANPNGCSTTNPLTGRFQVQKLDAAGAPLTGAAFALYPDALGKPDTTDTALTLTPQGTAGNLWSTPFLAAGTYWLTETQAPAGHVLLAAPVKVNVDATGTITLPGPSGPPITLTPAGEATVAIVSVADLPTLVLPLLGGTGTGPLTAGGALLLLLAGAWLIVALRRRTAPRRRP